MQQLHTCAVRIWLRAACSLLRYAGALLVALTAVLAMPTPTRALQPNEFERQVVALINQQRAALGGPDCPLLVANPRLSAVAHLHSQWMATTGVFSHTGVNNSHFFERLAYAGYLAMSGAENIAAGQSTPQTVVDAWMKSNTHKANILDCSFTETGVGYSASGNYWTQVFALRNTNAPSITVDPMNLPDVVLGTPFSQTFTARGGVAPYRFLVYQSQLPPGLSLASDGQLMGMPTRDGIFTFMVSAVDAQGPSACGRFTTNTGASINLPCIGAAEYTLEVISTKDTSTTREHKVHLPTVLGVGL